MNVRPLYDRIIVKRSEEAGKHPQRHFHSRLGEREAARGRSSRGRPWPKAR